MADVEADLERAVSLEALLGYLNYSEGKPDPRFQRQLDDAYHHLLASCLPDPWEALHFSLRAKLVSLQGRGSGPFQDVTQAGAVLGLGFDQGLVAYKRYHADLLFHLNDRELFQPFFVARLVEAILNQGPPWTEDDRIVTGAINQINDFVGHRPVAILETRPRGEPYDHERVRPIPLFIRGAGIAGGRYHDLMTKALEILTAADPAVLIEAHFDPELLDELGLDPRAFDHGHPVNRRPNYIFGEWDPHHMDNQGRYRRFVLRNVTLEALMHRLEKSTDLDSPELLTEAAAVLAGTILMASGVSGSSPDAHDSSTTLSTLLPRIARCREEFYEAFLDRSGKGYRLTKAHAERLQQERTETRQPFGAARQHLNQFLGRQRAAQLQQRHLALVFAEMGYAAEGREQAAQIPAASIRMQSDILGRLAGSQRLADKGRLVEAANALPEMEEILHRGIACGALADPWNILGFQALFPLFGPQEDSIRDHRIDELIAVMERIFSLYARLLSEAAAAGETALAAALGPQMERLAAWWDQFGSVEVSDVMKVHGGESAESAASVARALALWHERGEASADLAFWRQHLEEFRSPKAFALVLDTLLRKDDYRAAMGLLINWLAETERVPLEESDYSFHPLALRWLLGATATHGDSPEHATEKKATRLPEVKKFFDYLEANAEEFWNVPQWAGPGSVDGSREKGGLYSAAYEDVTYQDSSGGNQEGEVVGGAVEEFDLQQEAEAIGKRLRFLSTLARLWQIAARWNVASADDSQRAEWRQMLENWLKKNRENQEHLLKLLDAVHTHPIPEPFGTFEGLVEYDRRHAVKGQLLGAVIGTCLDAVMANGTLRGVLSLPAATAGRPAWEPSALQLEQALWQGDSEMARRALPAFLEQFREEPLLFVPLTEGGQPRDMLRARLAQSIVSALAVNLPRLGLLRETYHLLKTANAMEQAPTPKGRRISEFNHLFHLGYQSVVQVVVDSFAARSQTDSGERTLVDFLETVTEPFLALWIEHGKTLQLSTLESIQGEEDWDKLRQFVQNYGGDLFHARFMALANLRGILQRGVRSYLDYLAENPDPLHPVRLVEELDRRISPDEAVRHLQFLLQVVVENYEEYKDFNSSTAQSDYGENLFALFDFLLLKTSYERRAWQFRPLALVHEVLARKGEKYLGAAELWQKAFTDMTRDWASQHLERLAALEKAHGMRLGTIADRLGERFVKPLDLDRLCALVKPAMEESWQGNPGRSFNLLKEELKSYAASPSGVGLDVPSWLRRLEMEVQRVLISRMSLVLLAEDYFRVPQVNLAWDDLQRQVKDWKEPLPGSPEG